AHGKTWSFTRNFAKRHKIGEPKTMLKRTLTAFMLPLLLLFCNSSQNSVAGSKQKSPDAQSGSLEKMIVASGSVAMDIDLNRLNGVNSVTAKRETLRFTVAADSFFTALVFNDVLRGAEQGSIALIPQNSATLPAALSASLNQLVVEKLPSGEAFDLTVRDGKTGFAFFNIERLPATTGNSHCIGLHCRITIIPSFRRTCIA